MARMINYFSEQNLICKNTQVNKKHVLKLKEYKTKCLHLIF